MTDALRYEITHCWPNNDGIAFVKRSPHVCQPLGECPCISVLDEIAIITLPEKHEQEMAEIVRRSNAYDDLFNALDAILTDLHAVRKSIFATGEPTHIDAFDAMIDNARRAIVRAQGSS